MTAPLGPADVIRRRAELYVGDTRDGTGLMRMVLELVINAVDQFQLGHCSSISITLESDGAITVADDGAGFQCSTLTASLFWSGCSATATIRRSLPMSRMSN